MSEYTTIYVKRETAEKVKRLADAEGRLQYALVDRAVELYEKSIKVEQPSPAPTTEQQ